MGLRPAKLHEKLPLRRRCPPGTDETAMDFRRLLPEIRWQSRLSPVSGTGSPDWFFDPVLGFAHGRCTPFVVSPNRISPSHSRAPRPSVKLRNTIAMLEILGFSATHQARLVRQRAVSSVELVQAHLAHIATVNPRIHAVIEVFAATALAAADAADRAVAQGTPAGPLSGVPFSIKDSIELAGAVCTAGTLGRRAAPPATRDATLVARLRQAGAIPIARTNLPDLLFAFESDNLLFGATCNPYDATRTSGGSSGGEAALIASGGSPFGLGSDAAGSVRLPAAFCGIAAIKPTSGRLPRTGHFPPAGGWIEALWQIGPLSRRVEDLVLMMRLLAGGHGADPPTADMAFAPLDEAGLHGLRVAFYAGNGLVSTDRKS